MKLFWRKTEKAEVPQDRLVSDLIEEQQRKEASEVYRRAWCVERATLVLDDASPETVIRMAQMIYEYVYREKP